MDDRLAHSVRMIHHFFIGDGDLLATLDQLVGLTIDAVDADMAGLTIRDYRGRPTTAVHTEDMVLALDQAQYDHDSGPCLDAARTHTVFRVQDTATETRWTEFAHAAHAHGIHSSLSLPIVVANEGLGALNIYDHRIDHFDDETVRLGSLFAGQCSIAGLHWFMANEASNLAAALTSRAAIEQAKGIIMATTGTSADDAFDLLREQSQRENRKLREIAEEIVARQKR
jgi:transcriptional regulator with GAF, ATPase, and Fis domain